MKEFSKQIEKKSKMAPEQDTILQAIAQAAVEAGGTDNNSRMQNAVPKIGGLVMQQPTFNWKTKTKYS